MTRRLPVAAGLALAGLFLAIGAPGLIGWRAYEVPSSSMLPTLMVGDYVLCREGAYASAVPRRGDVVVHYSPDHIAAGGSRGQREQWIKRIVGLPGDRVRLDGGVLAIDGVAARQLPMGEARLRETLPDGRSYEILGVDPSGPRARLGPVTVPAGHYLMLGDNRATSLDSRDAPRGAAAWFLPAADIVCRVELIYWSGFGRLARIATALK